MRHNNNYFLDMDRNSILSFHEKIRPTREVTKNGLDKWLNKNQRCLNKKLAWAVEIMDDEEDMNEFKTNLENNLFPSVAAAAKMAAKLYAVHSKSYKANKSVVLIENGTRVIKKKRSELDEFKSSLLNDLRLKTFDEILTLIKMSTNAIKIEINQEEPSLLFAKKDSNDVERDLTHNHNRVATLVISKFYKLIKDAKVNESN